MNNRLRMEVYTVTETKTTPRIYFDLKWGILDVNGISIPEFPKEFYQPLIDKIKLYGQNPKATTTLNFSLIYFNSSSTTSLMEILSVFKNLNFDPNKLKINWYYDKSDEDQLETVKTLEELSSMPFNYIGV